MPTDCANMTCWVFGATAFILGAILGSFLNVVIHRGPRKWRLIDGEDRGGFAFPRSYCPSCRSPIRSVHLLPLASFFLLGGKCADCGARIPLRYPLVELAGALAGLSAFMLFGLSPLAAAAFVFFLLMITLAAIDAETGYLPDALTYPLIILGVVLNAFSTFASPGAAILGAVIGYGAFWLIDLVFQRLRGVQGLGLGDAKLLAGIGAWLGWTVLPPVVFLAALLGLFSAGLMAVGGSKVTRETSIPFGPALAASGSLALIAHGLRLPFFF